MDGQNNDQPVNQDNNQDAPVNNQNNQLADIRARALQALAPMVDGLEESAERKFEILMTAARYSDDDSLLDKALNAALAIEDSKTKAEALIDVVNESNYRLGS